MRLALLLSSAFSFGLVVLACGDLKNSVPADTSGNEGGVTNPDDAGMTSPGDGSPPAGSIVTVALLQNIDHVGARSSAGFAPWRSGIATSGGQVYWVESGATPGLYSVASDCSASSRCTKALVAKLTRPSAFHATATSMIIADTTQLKRILFASTTSAMTLASATDDIINIGVSSDESSVFWTFGDDEGIQRTAGGNTSIPINSNGTPVAMGSAGTKIYWTGCDISGLTCYVQGINQDGTSPGVVASITGGFQVFGGNDLYLYYAEGSPSNIHRKTLSTGHDDIVEMGGTMVTDFAIDDAYAYWAEAGDAPEHANGSISRVAHASKTSEPIASSVQLPVAIAVSGAQVFVGSAGTSAKSYADGAILSITITP